jgi:ABC-type Fe3+ transport system substrate-binding protein
MNPDKTHFVFRFLSFVLPLCLLVCLAASISSCGKSEDPNRVIYVVSPHASDIRLEFTQAFAAWHKQKYGYEVTLKWPDYGGTSDIVRALDNEYRTRNTSGFDVFFGGGSFTFDDAASKGFLEAPPNAAEIMRNFPADSPLVVLRRKDDPKDPEKNNLWFAATMSNFGIAINKVRISELGLKTPEAWRDLAEPEWFGQVSLADPSKSGSVRTCYEMIINQYGWVDGWGVLARMFANADAIKDGGSNPAEETDLGNTAAGVVIDFFARNHVAKLGPDVMGFVIPKGGSALDADPIAMLKGAPHKELAGHLIEFATSEEGQKLWVYRPGTPGGPAFKPLGRLAIREEMYSDPQRRANLFDATDPFVVSTAVKNQAPAQAAREAYLKAVWAGVSMGKGSDIGEVKRAIEALRGRDAGAANALEDKVAALPEYVGRKLSLGRYEEVAQAYYDVEAPGFRVRFIGDVMKAAFVDHHERLTEARKAINQLRLRDSARAAELERRLGELPAFGGQPLTTDRFEKLREVWSPKNRGDTEKNQTMLKDGWKAQFSELYREIAAEAKR